MKLRKSDLLIHITFAVGWLGAVAAYLALAIVGLRSSQVDTVRACYLSMEVVGWYVIVPFSLTAIAAGLLQALTTEWGLARHYWLLVKFLMTSAGSTILMLHMPQVSRVADLARANKLLVANPGLRLELVVTAAGGLLVLMTTTVISIYKPWGRTQHGRRVQKEKARRTFPARVRPSS